MAILLVAGGGEGLNGTSQRQAVRHRDTEGDSAPFAPAPTSRKTSMTCSSADLLAFVVCSW
jgi:hypothetical protein